MFTLFNLQGALGDFHRVLLRFIVVFTAQRSLFILAHPQPFVKHYFHFFLKMFEVLNRKLLCFSASLEAACIYYNTLSRLSTTFFNFFRVFLPL